MIKCGVTGSSGVLGSELIKIYKNKIKFKKFTGDIRKLNEVRKWINNNQFDSVIHLAAIVPTKIVDKNIKNAEAVNIKGSLNLAKSILQSKKKIWLFFSSTSHVYKIPNRKIKINEKSKLKPYSKYGETKLKAEKVLIKEFKRKKKLNLLCIGRIFSFTNHSQKKSFLIPNLSEKIKKQQKPILKNLNHYRDFLSVNDICSAIIILMRKKTSGIFNVCSSIPINLTDIAKFLSKNFKKKVQIKNSSGYTYLVGNNSKLKSIGWINKENINKIIKNYLLKVKY